MKTALLSGLYGLTTRLKQNGGFLGKEMGTDIGADNRARADKGNVKTFLLNLKVFFSPEKENTLQPDKQPGRKPPSVMPKPPIDPPKYEADYPDVDEMYRRFVSAGKHSQYRAKQSRKRTNFLK